MAFTDFYRSDRWRKMRMYLMNERETADGLICAHCGKPIVRSYEAILHHVIELTPQNVNDDTIAYNPENLVFVHPHCHNEIHNRFGGHKHADSVNTTFLSCPMITVTTCGAYWDIRDENPPVRTAQTDTEFAFDVVTIDKTARKIYLTRIGAGNNREVDY